MHEANHSETPETAKEKLMAHSSKSTDKKRKISRRHKKIGIPGIKEVYVARSNADTLLGDIADTVRGKASNLPSVKPPKSKANRVRKVGPRNMATAFKKGRTMRVNSSSVRAGTVRGGTPKGTK